VVHAHDMRESRQRTPLARAAQAEVNEYARPGLWRHRDFLRLWAGETVSFFGSEITELALPLAAVLTLGADARELGLLGAARFAPYLVFTLPVGVIADRVRRRPILVWANLGRAVAIGLVPVLAAVGLLTFPLLLAVAFAVGVLTVFFEVTYVSYLPSVVGREHLVEGNSRLQASASVAAIGGPGLGGLLVELLTAPMALAVDAVSYLVSALTLASIRAHETARSAGARVSALEQVAEGFRLLRQHPALRALAGVAGTYNLFSQWISVLFVLFAIQELGISPTTLGLVLSAGAAGALLGAVMADPVARWFGIGRALVWAVVLECVAMLPIGLVTGPLPIVLAVLVTVFAVNGCFVTMSSVHALAYRQAVAPQGMLGRISASYRIIGYGGIPLGAVLGGLAGETFGVRTGLVVGSIGLLAAAALVLTSPLRDVRELPQAET
jgi:MFS family permease